MAPHPHWPSCSVGQVLANGSQLHVPWTQRCPLGHGGSQGTQLPWLQNADAGQAQVPPQPSAPQWVPSQSGTHWHVPPTQVSGWVQMPQEPPQPSPPQSFPVQSGAQPDRFLWRLRRRRLRAVTSSAAVNVLPSSVASTVRREPSRANRRTMRSKVSVSMAPPRGRHVLVLVAYTRRQDLGRPLDALTAERAGSLARASGRMTGYDREVPRGGKFRASYMVLVWHYRRSGTIRKGPNRITVPEPAGGSYRAGAACRCCWPSHGIIQAGSAPSTPRLSSWSIVADDAIK